MSPELRALHMALLEVIGSMNERRRDEALIVAAGIRLDRALFRLLIGIERIGPIGVVELAAGVNRDHTTLAGQLAKLECLGLIMRVESADDRRTRRAVVSPEGRTMAERIDAARERMPQPRILRSARIIPWGVWLAPQIRPPYRPCGCATG